ncbi:MAG: methyltransferase domain-containing protein [Blastocatellia bacterium]
MSDKERNVLEEWRGSAPYWEKHGKTIRIMFAPITRALIEAAGIRKGQSVLDVAGGTGEPSITIAEVVGQSGRVVCTDAVAEMVAAAEREADLLKLGNIEFRQCLADSLPFPDNEFDVVVSRLGAMFFPAPDDALGEMLRVAKPGGRVALAVWGVKEANPFFSAVTEVMSRYLESPPEDPCAPGAFRFSERGKLTRLLETAGAIEIDEQAVNFQIQAKLTPREFWPLRVEISDSLRTKVSSLPPAQLSLVAEEVAEAVREHFHDGRMNMPAQVIVVRAKKAHLTHL